MTIKELLTRHEGRRAHPYKCTAGKKTIGIGHNIDAKGLPDDIESFLYDNDYITDEMIDRLFERDLADVMEDVEAIYPDFNSYSDNVQAALIDFVFNVGRKTAASFVRTNAAIKAQNWDEAADLLLASKYARQVGRRAEEVADLLRRG